MGKNQSSICREATVKKPEGGYRLIPLARLYKAWRSYRAGDLQLRDLRAYFALEEMAARRCVLKKGRTARFTPQELAKLLTAGEGTSLASSLKRLDRAGLCTWSAQRIEFCQSNHAAAEDEFFLALRRITNYRRQVPVPRRTLRWLATERRPVVIATVLGPDPLRLFEGRLYRR